jgi:hypothetical protein
MTGEKDAANPVTDVSKINYPFAIIMDIKKILNVRSSIQDAIYNALLKK